MTRNLLYRPMWLSMLIISIALFAALSLLVGSAWNSLHRLEPIRAHQTQLNHLQQAGLGLQDVLVNGYDTEGTINLHRLATIRRRIGALAHEGGYLNAKTPGRLQRVHQLLAHLNPRAPRRSLVPALDRLRQVLTDETAAHNALLNAVDRDTHLELQVAVVIAVGLPLLALLAGFVLRRRIIYPLRNLGELMTMLSERDYRSLPASRFDPLLQPLFDNYNRMVTRLARLEDEHQARRHTLEQEVRAATRTLLQQQRSLARAERLAAVGEMAASLAHELRNPLAGLQMALGNLRREMEDPGRAQRVDLMSKELKRVVRLLNDTLQQSHHRPDPPVELDLGETVSELLGLLRYQLPPQIELVETIPPGLHCRLPEGNLRQALLNLILNAAHAIGERTGRIEVRADTPPGHLRLEVHDDGPGFPSALLESGIRSFASWSEHGTGLGLAMVRRFARDLGGNLALANGNPQGATVTLQLPCGRDHV